MGNIFNPRVFVAVGAAAIVACLAAGTRTSNVPYVNLPYDGLAAGMGVLAGCLLLGAVYLHRQANLEDVFLRLTGRQLREP